MSSISSILSVPGGSKIDLQLVRQLKMTPDLLKSKEKSENNATPSEGSAGIGDHVRSGRGQCVDERSVWYEPMIDVLDLCDDWQLDGNCDREPYKNNRNSCVNCSLNVALREFFQGDVSKMRNQKGLQAKQRKHPTVSACSCCKHQRRRRSNKREDDGDGSGAKRETQRP